MLMDRRPPGRCGLPRQATRGAFSSTVRCTSGRW